MESLLLSFNAIAPIFLLMLLGYVLKALNVADEKTFDTINKLVFKIFLQILLFYNIYKTETLEIFDVKLITFIIIFELCLFIVGYIAVILITKDNPKRGVMLQGFYRSNFAFLGVPLVGYIYGDNSTGLASMMVAIVVPLFNILAVFSLERFRGGKLSLKKLIIGVLKNPLIIGCAIGIICMIFKIKFPKFIETSISDIAKIATPLAIIVLGASFTFSSMHGYGKEITIVTLTRLVIVPLIGIAIAVFAGIRGEALACLLVTLGSPVAISSITMSQQMDGDGTLAAHNVVVTSTFCIFTLFIWIFILSFMNLL